MVNVSAEEQLATSLEQVKDEFINTPSVLRSCCDFDETIMSCTTEGITCCTLISPLSQSRVLIYDSTRRKRKGRGRKKEVGRNMLYISQLTCTYKYL